MFDDFLTSADSASFDLSSTSTQDSPCESINRKGFQNLRSRLKLQHVNSSKPLSLQKGSEPLSGELPSATEGKSSVLKKKFQDVYTSLETIGQGSCGVVKRVLHNEENKIYVAKIVRARDQEKINQIKREYQILSKLNHKNIIKAKELFVEEAFGNAQLILEYFEGQTLEELVMEQGQVKEQRVRQMVEQMVSALKHIHDKGICHRDITASNILINENNEVKLIDFNISKIIRPELFSPAELISASSSAKKKKNSLEISDNNFMMTNAGTDYYKAPEVVTGVPYNHSVDMWSLGVNTFYALAGYKPFTSKNLDRLYNKINKADYQWDPLLCGNISHEAVLFVKACLNPLPFVRISAREALYNAWIKGIKLDLDRNERNKCLKHESPPVRREHRLESTKVLKSFVLDFTEMDY